MVVDSSDDNAESFESEEEDGSGSTEAVRQHVSEKKQFDYRHFVTEAAEKRYIFNCDKRTISPMK